MTQLTACRPRLTRGEGPGAFTLEALHRSTAGMSGSARADVFYRLPEAMQAEAWRYLAEQVERDREMEMAS